MIASARAELLRLSKWPVTWIVFGVWLALNVGFGYVLNYLTYRDLVDAGNDRAAEALLTQLSSTGAPVTMVTGLPMFGGALVLTLAAVATGSGYGWNTWKTVFTQGNGRQKALAGTATALAALLVVFVALTTVVNLGAGAVVTAVESQSFAWPDLDALAKSFGGALLIAMMWSMVGAAVGIIAKGPSVAVGLGLVWVVVVENLLRGVAGLLGPFEAVVHVMPGTAAGSLAGALGAPDVSQPGGAPAVNSFLTGTEAAWLLVAYIVAFAVLAGFTASRRDA
ncbi:MAG: ABC transporter permease [Stackebrandtia sp.]